MNDILFFWLVIALFFLLFEMGSPGLFFFLSFFFGGSKEQQRRNRLFVRIIQPKSSDEDPMLSHQLQTKTLRRKKKPDLSHMYLYVHPAPQSSDEDQQPPNHLNETLVPQITKSLEQTTKNSGLLQKVIHSFLAQQPQ